MILRLPKSVENIDETHEAINSEDDESANETATRILNKSMENAIEQYKKIRIGDREDLTEKEIAEIDKECEIIRNREIIDKDFPHEQVEITSKDDQIVIGPPILTRFEKARIMGARALQLSLGAPVFIEIPKNATTSLEIAMEELKQRVIPIVIKRTLPNGDYQIIPLDKFE
jgi:DNA-directed RNA polymerase I, II, and III subunit RPABC2